MVDSVSVPRFYSSVSVLLSKRLIAERNLNNRITEQKRNFKGMSRIGKKPIIIPQGVTVTREDGRILIRGPKGELFHIVSSDIKVDIDGNVITIVPEFEKRMKEGKRKAQWGTTRAIIANKIMGVQEGFQKKLELEGVGYRAQAEGTSTLVLYVGFTNPIRLEVPSGISVSVDKNVITVSGIDKAEVGQFAARVRKTREVEPYKGKGIRYQGEQVMKKAGKKVVATTK
jgi:large subunit ribosomal protein L6